MILLSYINKSNSFRLIPDEVFVIGIIILNQPNNVQYGKLKITFFQFNFYIQLWLTVNILLFTSFNPYFYFVFSPPGVQYDLKQTRFKKVKI